MRTMLILGLAAALAGCGSAPCCVGALPEQGADSYSATTVAKALHVVSTDGGLSYEDRGTRCIADVLLSSGGEVSLYADAGDPVATNPSRTAGAVYSTYEGEDPSLCYDVFTERLKALP